ncbi:MAG TPA: alpha/beta fold hydrolase [Steroidobacteraceae bacterium]|nr:alpha/beta fold hydrolase [Steroidobacteraceae bacterium]
MLARRILTVLSAALLLAGCVSSMLARTVVAPPNKSGIKPLFADGEILKRAPEAFAATWTVEVGPPRAQIAVASIEPGDYGFTYDLQMGYPQDEDPKILRFTAEWRAASERVPSTHPPRGTVLLLHGYLQNRNSVTPWAVKLAQAGFRCVVFDLRGHGESTGDHISFGAFESRDVSQLLDDLERRGWDVSRVGLFGLSYGASVALVTAGLDTRVASVVAFEPFASAETAVPELMRAAFATRARGISDEQFARAHRKEAAIAGFNWADADIPAALKRAQAPVLFFHGEQDRWLSPEHSRALLAVAPPGSRLELAPLENHVSLPLHFDTFAPAVIAWFEAGLH